MVNLQNPSIPLPTTSIEIDAVVMDIQTKLDVNLSWLSHGYARAYRHIKHKDNKMLYFPEVYAGIQNNAPAYYRPTPDNDKKGMCFFVVGPEGNDFINNQYNYLNHDIGIVFWVNLSLINNGLLTTEIFTQNLISDVRNVLTRKLLGTNYKLTINKNNGVVREFSEVYKEFSLEETENYLMAPYQAFRFNCNVEFQENCIGGTISNCNALQQNISKNEILSCLLPTLDFTDTDTFNALSDQQKEDLLTALTV